MCVCVCCQVKRVVVYLGRDKTMQLLEELMCELDLTDPVSSAVTHMDNPPYYRITSSYKIPSVTSAGIYHTVHCLRNMYLLFFIAYCPVIQNTDA